MSSSTTATSTSNSSPIPSSGVVFGGLSGGKGNLLRGIDIWFGKYGAMTGGSKEKSTRQETWLVILAKIENI